jgi:hypothetical protein
VKWEVGSGSAAFLCQHCELRLNLLTKGGREGTGYWVLGPAKYAGFKVYDRMLYSFFGGPS